MRSPLTEVSAEVDRKQPVPNLPCHCIKIIKVQLLRDPSVIDQIIDSSECLGDGLYHAAHFAIIGDIRLHSDRLPTNAVYHLCRLFGFRFALRKLIATAEPCILKIPDSGFQLTKLRESGSRNPTIPISNTASTG